MNDLVTLGHLRCAVSCTPCWPQRRPGRNQAHLIAGRHKEPEYVLLKSEYTVFHCLPTPQAAVFDVL